MNNLSDCVAINVGEVLVRIFDMGTRGGPEHVSDAIFTVPNVLSVLRLSVLPLVYIDITNGRYTRSLVVLGIFSSTDWFDGYIARRFNQITKLGKVLDPISDRALITVVGVAVVVADLVPLWAIAILIGRDVLVLIGTLFLVRRHITPPAVTRIGKAATFGLMFTLPTFILAAALAPDGQDHLDWLRWLGWLFYVSATVQYLIATVQYAVEVKRQLRSDPTTEAASA